MPKVLWEWIPKDGSVVKRLRSCGSEFQKMVTLWWAPNNLGRSCLVVPQHHHAARQKKPLVSVPKSFRIYGRQILVLSIHFFRIITDTRAKQKSLAARNASRITYVYWCLCQDVASVMWFKMFFSLSVVCVYGCRDVRAFVRSYVCTCVYMCVAVVGVRVCDCVSACACMCV